MNVDDERFKRAIREITRVGQGGRALNEQFRQRVLASKRLYDWFLAVIAFLEAVSGDRLRITLIRDNNTDQFEIITPWARFTVICLELSKE